MIDRCCVNYIDADFCIMGDLNARSGVLDLFDVLNDQYDCWQPDDDFSLLTLRNLIVQEKSAGNNLFQKKVWQFSMQLCMCRGAIFYAKTALPFQLCNKLLL